MSLLLTPLLHVDWGQQPASEGAGAGLALHSRGVGAAQRHAAGRRHPPHPRQVDGVGPLSPGQRALPGGQSLACLSQYTFCHMMHLSHF